MGEGRSRRDSAQRLVDLLQRALLKAQPHLRYLAKTASTSAAVANSPRAHFGSGFDQIAFFGRQLEDRLFIAGISQQHAGGLLLHFERERLHLLDGSSIFIM